MKTIIVTGGAGFIGSHTIEALLQDGAVSRVVCIDNFDDNYDPALKRENIALFSSDSRFKLYEADIRDAEKMREIFLQEKPDAVIHLAAKADARHAVEEPSEYVSTNVDGTLNLLEAARAAGTKKFVFASSSSVYGNKNTAPFKEDAQTDFPISPYGATKKAGEVLAYSYFHNFGMDITCIRIFNAYGERMRPGLVLYKWIDDILHERTVEMSGEGTRMRDFTYVGDTVHALILAVQKQVGFEVLNVGSADPISLKDLLAVAEKATGKKAQVVSRESAKASVEMTHADVTKAKNILGWEPLVSIEEGVKRLTEWFVRERLK